MNTIIPIKKSDNIKQHTMKRTILLLINIFILANIVYSQSRNQNYVYTKTYLGKGKTEAIHQIDYLDGLGRSIQSVQKQITFSGADLASFQQYDASGKKKESWLPVVAESTNDGSFISIGEFHNLSNKTYKDANAYSLPVYESSPLNRIIAQTGPGANWHRGSKSVRIEYFVNERTGLLSCKRYYTTNEPSEINISIVSTSSEPRVLTTTVEKDGVSRKGQLISGDSILISGIHSQGETYSPGDLTVTKTTDEQGNISFEFQDKFGQVILSRQMESGEPYDTYYIYDVYNNLRAVLPPLASDALNGGSWDETNSPILQQYAYLYKYDDMNRIIEKKLPGCEPIVYQYDNADRLIFSQDGEQRAKDTPECTFYLYDAFGRLTIQGFCADEGKPQVEELTVKSTFNNYASGILGTAYTCNIGIAPTSIAVVNYYDNYDFLSRVSGFTPADDLHLTFYNSQGFLTGNIVYVQDDNEVRLCSSMYYDAKGNLVKTVSGNHLGGLDIISTTYTFSNNPETVEHTHTTSPLGHGKQIQTYRYKYDHGNRLVQVDYTLNNSTITLAVNEYDELGRIQNVKRNGNPGLTNEYAYNLRSWLTRISGKHFSSRLEYTDNGNVSSMSWGAGVENRSYGYKYDGLSRLLSADYTGAIYTEKYGTNYMYDKHGNIKKLIRYGKTPTDYDVVDNLEMIYQGNQLINLTEYVPDFELAESNDLKTSSTYQYNENGAMIKDSGKKITQLSYNSLNLPTELTIDGSTIYYMYTSDGRKLQVKQGNLTRDYVGDFVYENDELKRVLFDGGYWEDGEFYFYFNDHLGNVRAVADASGEIVQQNVYYPFGLPTAEISNDEQGKQPYKFGKKEYDKSLGLNLYDFSARQLDPGLGRFTSVDPLAEKYYSMSPYNYVGNNPILNIDPLGKDYWSTNDPDEIRKFWESLISSGSNNTLLSFEFDNWDHMGDEEFISYVENNIGYNLSFNDETGMFYASYVNSVDPEWDIVGVSKSWDDIMNFLEDINSSNKDNSINANLLRGPALWGISGDFVPKNSKFAKLLWNKSRVVMGASKNTSILSLVLRRNLPQKSINYLPKAGSLGGQLGRLGGKFLGPLGIGLTIYDSFKLGYEYGPISTYIENKKKFKSVLLD